MKHCTHCGHLLGLGRFCTNCGHPVAARPPTRCPTRSTAARRGPRASAGRRRRAGREDWRTDTAERVRGTRPARRAGHRPSGSGPPRVPPAAVEPPPPPRFPLFADEVDVAGRPGARPPSSLRSPSSRSPPRCPSRPARGRRRQVTSTTRTSDEDWDDWVDDRRRRAVLGRRRAGGARGARRAAPGSWAGTGRRRHARTTRRPPAPTSRTGAGRPHRRRHRRGAPDRAAQPGRRRQPVSYDASNMLDGVPETAWRAAGDGDRAWSSRSRSPRRPR